MLGTPNTASYYVWLWNVLKKLLPMSAIRWALKRSSVQASEDLTERLLRNNSLEERREECDREIARLNELGEELGMD